ncbi:MAG: hypothetical protein PW788_10650 [Micavibrio sp.]|nr:hypothetical protein [Micavibrio sp.]
MKKTIAILALLTLSACGTISEVPSADANMHRLVFKSSASDTWSGSSSITPYYAVKMGEEARRLCPYGYDKVREGQVLKPDDGSFSYWDIRCTKQ